MEDFHHDKADCRALCCLDKGQEAKIVHMETPEGFPSFEAVIRRLLHLGFVSGKNVRILNKAPFFRDPILVEVAGSQIALTEWEAAHILVR